MRKTMLITTLIFLVGSNSALQANAICAGVPDVSQFGWDGDLSQLIDGYCVEGRYTPDLITREFYNQSPPNVFETRALYQSEGLLEETAALNQLRWDDKRGLIALMSPATVGWAMNIQLPESSEWIPVIQADNVKREHYYDHVIWNQSGLELNYALAQELGVIERVNEDGSRYRYGVKVCIYGNALDCTDDPISFVDWFKDNVRYSSAS